MQKSDAYLTESKDAPEVISKREVMMADATIKGINQTLVDHSRAAFCTAESADSYECEFLHTTKGVHPLPVTRMNLLSQCEPVDTITGAGAVHLGSKERPYTLMHKVFGQTDHVCLLGKAVFHGFDKRFVFRFLAGAAPHDDGAQMEAAHEVIQSMHDWLYRHNMGTARVRVLAPGALVLHEAQRLAIEHHITEIGAGMSENWVSKLRFFYSDTLRASNIAARKSNALGAIYAGRVWVQQQDTDHFAYVMGLHKWRRGLHVKKGINNYWAAVVSHQRAMHMRIGRPVSLSNCLQDLSQTEGSSMPEPLPEEEQIKISIISHSNFSACARSVKDFRLWLKNRFPTSGLADKILTGAKALVTSGLFVKVPSPPHVKDATAGDDGHELEASAGGERGKRKRATTGRKLQWYQKNKKAVVEGLVSAEQERVRLGVSISVFPT